MKRGPLLAAVAGFAALILLGVVLLDVKVDADASALSAGAHGWLAARRYLEERGCRVSLLDRPLSAPLSARVVAVAFPWQRMEPDPGGTVDALEDHLRGGGTLLLAVSDEAPAPGQELVLKALGLGWHDMERRPPLLPWRWREFTSAEWTLSSEDDPQATRVRIPRPRRLLHMPAAGRALWRGPERVPVVFSFRRHRGRVVVLPATVFANAWIAAGANADLLEQLHAWLGDEWAFDEFHHGLVGAQAAQTTGPGSGGLDLFLLHLALVYGFAVVALVRRFGPAWSEPAVVSGSTGGFLVALGALHHRLGHHAAAARLLIERAQELDPRLELPPVAPGEVTEGEGLVALAARIVQGRNRRGEGGR
jgi:hypothetical protein